MFQVYRIAQENPSPTNIWPQLIRYFWCKGNTISIFLRQFIHLIRIRTLKHDSIIISLWFDIIRINIIKLLKESCKTLSYAIEKCFSMVYTGQRIRNMPRPINFSCGIRDNRCTNHRRIDASIFPRRISLNMIAKKQKK